MRIRTSHTLTSHGFGPDHMHVDSRAQVRLHYRHVRDLRIVRMRCSTLRLLFPPLKQYSTLLHVASHFFHLPFLLILLAHAILQIHPHAPLHASLHNLGLYCRQTIENFVMFKMFIWSGLSSNQALRQIERFLAVACSGASPSLALHSLSSPFVRTMPTSGNQHCKTPSTTSPSTPRHQNARKQHQSNARGKERLVVRLAMKKELGLLAICSYQSTVQKPQSTLVRGGGRGDVEQEI